MTGRHREPEELRTVAEELAVSAGEVCRRWFGEIGEGQVSFKSRRDPVTAADLESEALLRREIRRRYPDDAVLGEEGGSHAGSSGYEWVVDPLDGTVNFAQGLPLYAVSVAVRREGQILAGAVHAPELGHTATAARGGGTLWNGRPVQVSDTATLQDALLATGFAYRRNELEDDNVAHVADLVLRCRDLRRLGAAAYDLALVASGRLDGYWELHLQPWDMAAGVLLVREAGGRVSDFEGGEAGLDRGTVVASNGHFHEELRQRLVQTRPA